MKPSGLVFSVRSLLVGAALIFGVVTPAISSELEDYKLEYHQAGELVRGYVPGSVTGTGKGYHATTASRGFSVFSANGLIYFVERGTVTIYRPGEGLFTRVQYDSKRIEEDVDGTKTVDFRRWPAGAPRNAPIVMAIRHPNIIAAWDGALSDPLSWLSNYGVSTKSHFVTYKGGRLYVDGPRVNITRSGRTAPFDAAEQFLLTATATTAVPTIASVRSDAAQWDARSAQQSAAASAREVAAKQRREAIVAQASQRFLEASKAKKEVGTTVCSSDNRWGYVEQISGPRVKILLRGRAIGSYGDFGDYGPYSTGDVQSTDAGEFNTIEDPNFLFRPINRNVRFANLSDVIWDESRYWGLCSYR